MERMRVRKGVMQTMGVGWPPCDLFFFLLCGLIARLATVRPMPVAFQKVCAMIPITSRQRTSPLSMADATLGPSLLACAVLNSTGTLHKQLSEGVPCLMMQA
jgi:hypothetical protein